MLTAVSVSACRAAAPHPRPGRRTAALLRGWLGSLARRCDGMAAVEFSLVLLPFIGLVLATLETSVLLFNESILDGAVNAAARQIRTGQVADTTTTLQAFAQQVCANLASQLPCSSVDFDVRSFPSFSTVNLPDPVYNPDGTLANASFVTGGAGAVVVVRAIYHWTPLTPGLDKILGPSPAPSNVTYTVVLRNEPF